MAEVARELCVRFHLESVIVVLFLTVPQLAVVHCPLALQLADGVSRRQALSLASGAAAASVLNHPGAATAAAAASPLKLPSFGVGAWAWGDSLF